MITDCIRNGDVRNKSILLLYWYLYIIRCISIYFVELFYSPDWIVQLTQRFCITLFLFLILIINKSHLCLFLSIGSKYNSFSLSLLFMRLLHLNSILWSFIYEQVHKDTSALLLVFLLFTIHEKRNKINFKCFYYDYCC